MSDEVLAWLSDWVNALYYSPADATAIPSSFASLKPRIGYLPGARFIMFCLEIRPLNDCNVSSFIMPEWIGRDAERSDGKVNVHVTSKRQLSPYTYFSHVNDIAKTKTHAHRIEPCVQPLHVATSLYRHFTATIVYSLYVIMQDNQD